MKKTKWKLSTGLAVCLAALLGTIQFSQAKTVKSLAKAAEPMTTAQLYALYANRSWIWNKEAGHFAIRKRRFSSAGTLRSGKYAEGIWYLPGRGKVCFRAVWHGDWGAAKKRTCFEHRADRRKIYQKRLPDGEWYVFRNAPPRRGDEARKLKRGNYVAYRFRKNQARKQAFCKDKAKRRFLFRKTRSKRPQRCR